MLTHRAARGVFVETAPGEDGWDAASTVVDVCGGQHRTRPRFRELARAAKLDVAVAARRPSGYLVVECRTV